MLRVAGLVLALIAGPALAADAPQVGAWRNLHSASGSETMQRNLAFAMVPAPAQKGDRFAVLDREGRQVVCCLVVDSERLDAIALETRYRLPGVWIADLLGDEDSNRRRGEPYVYAMQRDATLAAHVFADAAGAYSDLGGLLLPAGSVMEPGTDMLRLGAQRYRLQFRSQRFADENGALDRYTLQPAAADAATLVVDVPYSTY